MLAGFDLGDVEHVVDQAEQMLAGVLDVPGVFERLVGRGLGFFQAVGDDLREADDGAERRAQFVTHMRQAFGARDIGGVGLVQDRGGQLDRLRQRSPGRGDARGALAVGGQPGEAFPVTLAAGKVNGRGAASPRRAPVFRVPEEGDPRAPPAALGRGIRFLTQVPSVIPLHDASLDRPTDPEVGQTLIGGFDLTYIAKPI